MPMLGTSLVASCSVSWLMVPSFDSARMPSSTMRATTAPKAPSSLKRSECLMCGSPKVSGAEFGETHRPPWSAGGRCPVCAGDERRLRVCVAQRPGRREQLTGLEQCLEAGEDHRPAAEELVVRTLAQLVVRDGQPARVGHLLDLPGDARGVLALDVVAPERVEALDQAVR